MAITAAQQVLLDVLRKIGGFGHTEEISRSWYGYRDMGTAYQMLKRMDAAGIVRCMGKGNKWDRYDYTWMLPDITTEMIDAMAADARERYDLQVEAFELRVQRVRDHVAAIENAPWDELGPLVEKLHSYQFDIRDAYGSASRTHERLNELARLRVLLAQEQAA